jgi:hypothetical protein
MTLQPEKVLPTQNGEQTINIKMDNYSHKGEDLMDREVPQYQPLIPTINKRASGALTAEYPPKTQLNVEPK